MAQRKQVPFKQVIASLIDARHPFPPSLLHHFSDLNAADFAALKHAWPQVTPQRKVSLLEDLEMIAESDTLVNFDELSKFALTDPKPAVRAIATRLLWESNDPKLISTFLDMAEKDSDEMVRASAATALGQYVYMGELEEISELMLKKIVERLLAIVNGADLPIVRRRALESLGYSMNDQVPVLLRKFIAEKEPEWKASALFAMGRSLNQAWKPEIARHLSNPDPQIQLEAVRAAGNLEFNEASEVLLDLLDDEELDEEVRMAVIWSLSQIGGNGVRERLEQLLDEADDDEADLIEEALDNLSFTEMSGSPSLLEIDEVDENLLDDLDGLDLDDDSAEKSASRKRHKPKN